MNDENELIFWHCFTERFIDDIHFFEAYIGEEVLNC